MTHVILLASCGTVTWLDNSSSVQKHILVYTAQERVKVFADVQHLCLAHSCTLQFRHGPDRVAVVWETNRGP